MHLNNFEVYSSGCYSNCDNYNSFNEQQCDSSGGTWLESVPYCNQLDCVADNHIWSLDHDGVLGGNGLINLDGRSSISEYISERAYLGEWPDQGILLSEFNIVISGTTFE